MAKRREPNDISDFLPVIIKDDVAELLIEITKVYTGFRKAANETVETRRRRHVAALAAIAAFVRGRVGEGPITTELFELATNVLDPRGELFRLKEPGSRDRTNSDPLDMWEKRAWVCVAVTVLQHGAKRKKRSERAARLSLATSRWAPMIRGVVRKYTKVAGQPDLAETIKGWQRTLKKGGGGTAISAASTLYASESDRLRKELGDDPGPDVAAQKVEELFRKVFSKRRSPAKGR
jgi:hypothetical protein